MKRLPAAAKINLALLVGPAREDGLHELVTVMQRIDICDAVEVAPAQSLAVDGFRKGHWITHLSMIVPAQ